MGNVAQYTGGRYDAVKNSDRSALCAEPPELGGGAAAEGAVEGSGAASSACMSRCFRNAAARGSVGAGGAFVGLGRKAYRLYQYSSCCSKQTAAAAAAASHQQQGSSERAQARAAHTMPRRQFFNFFPIFSKGGLLHVLAIKPFFCTNAPLLRLGQAN